MVRTERPPRIAAVDGENDAVTPPGRPLTLSATGVPNRSVAAWNETVILGSVTCPDRDRRRAEPHCVVPVRRRRGVYVARDVRGSGSLAGERRRRLPATAGGDGQCRRRKRRFQQRSGVNAKHCSPPGMSGDSASQLRAIRSRENIHPGCNDADADLKRPAPQGQRCSLPARSAAAPAPPGTRTRSPGPSTSPKAKDWSRPAAKPSPEICAR